MDSTIAALLGAVIGGLLSVAASWLAQHVQMKTQCLSLEIQRRQQLYSEFMEAASHCFADALQRNELDKELLAKLFSKIGRMRLQSCDTVVTEASRVAQTILAVYAGDNLTMEEVRKFLSSDTVDVYAAFGDACRAELVALQPLRIARAGPLGYLLSPAPPPSVAVRGEAAAE
jgi:hypothetical protein